MTLTRRLLARVGPYRVLLAAGITAALVASILDGLTVALLIPLLRALFETGPVIAAEPTLLETILAKITGPWFEAASIQVVLRNIVLAILGVTALKGVAGFFGAWANAKVTESVGRDIRRDLFRKLQQLKLGFHQKQKAGDLISRVVSDVDQTKTVFHEVIPEAVHRAMTVLVYLAMLAAVSFELTLAVLILAPVVATLLSPVFVKVRKSADRAAGARSRAVVFLHEALSGMREIKVAGGESYEERKFDAASLDLARHQTSSFAAKGLSGPLGETAGALVLVVLVLLGAGTVFDARIRPELVVVYLTVALRMLSPVKRLAYAPAQLQHALASWTRVVEILDSKEDDTDDEDATKRPVDQPTRIVFDNVRFAYVDEEFVLDGVDLTIKRGEVLGVIGPSGEGKSTLLDLLPRFIDPAEGHVSVDGVPTTELSRKGLRRIIGYVGQETVVFHDTVSKNISYGEPLDREAVVVAAKAACAHEFIEQLPHGYDTVLGERGTLLSAGQRQRIALARVLLRNPPVLLLDEATSALDQETESRVYAGLKEFFEERIVVIVAHRPSSLSAAQNVAVLRSGKIVHFGPKTGRNESGFDAEPAEVSQSSAEESKSPVMKNDEREF